MIICPKCGRQLEDGAKFCDSCGEKVAQVVTCPSCGKQMFESVAFCQYCGAKIEAKEPVAAAACASAPAYASVSAPSYNDTPMSSSAPATATASMPARTTAPVPAPMSGQPFMAQPGFAAPAAGAGKPFPKKAVMFGGIGLAAAAVIVILIVLIAGLEKPMGDNFTVYVKDGGELYLNKFSDDPWQIAEKFGLTSNIEIFADSDTIEDYITVSKDGRLIFYPDRYTASSLGVSLYCKGLNSDEGGARIDTSVAQYSVNDSASVVTYIKTGGNNLYQYTLKTDEKNKIDSDVTDFYVSDDGGKIIYCNNEGGIYSYSRDTDSKEKIDSDSDIRYCSDDLTTLYYLKDNNLYKKVEGEDKVKIASDVRAVYTICDSGELYYIKETEKIGVPYMDFVDDDLKDADALITEPKFPEYPDYPDYPKSPSRPYRFRYDSDEEYEKAVEEYNKALEKYEQDVEKYNDEVDKIRADYDEAKDKYYDDYDKYQEKISRDYLRESLNDLTVDYADHALYYYNGTEEKEISASFNSISAESSGSSAIVFSAYDRDNIGLTKLSEIQNVYDFGDKVSTALYSERDFYFVSKGTVSALNDVENSYDIVIDKNGETLYYISADEEDTVVDLLKGNLYSVAIVDGAVQSPELYDTDVSTARGYPFLTFYNDKLAYWKEIELGTYNAEAGLYIEKEKIDSDITYFSLEYNKELDTFTYIIDRDSKGMGTLKVYKNGTAEKISDDVSDFCVLPNGKILYMYDYNINRCRGELYVYDNGKTEKVDEDVVAILKITDEKYKGNLYKLYGY